ncbi:putative prophage antirepressor protein, BRO family [Rhizobium phage RHEph01]|uniref:Putative prophage antirepressor protein, BRO family n=1 Tax=Rhizobium phage RHEph01 TaxID=1220601 RepID=L7TLS6_9CAUD|nr:anti-repressor Ant [Rhizobium phage RHEph01]AGC35522.1 putative prophage antirepressor protein, BRO family [Rhizobium phage RHEph01]
MQKLFTFDYRMTQIRVVMIDNQPWFVGGDVCQALGLTKYTSSGFARHYSKLGAGQITNPASVCLKITWRGSANAKLVSLDGLFKLAMRSGSLDAREFLSWVDAVVVPTTSGDLPPIQQVAQEKTVTKAENLRAQAKLLLEAADALDALKAAEARAARALSILA